MEDPILLIASALGVKPAMVITGLIIASMGLNVLGRAIPDDKGGFLGIVRKIAKVGGLYLSNRLESGVSVNSVVRDMPEVVTGLAHDAAQDKVESIVPEMVVDMVKSINPVTGAKKTVAKSKT